MKSIAEFYERSQLASALGRCFFLNGKYLGVFTGTTGHELNHSEFCFNFQSINGYIITIMAYQAGSDTFYRFPDGNTSYLNEILHNITLK